MALPEETFTAKQPILNRLVSSLESDKENNEIRNKQKMEYSDIHVTAINMINVI